jgi:hypothetical protein
VQTAGSDPIAIIEFFPYRADAHKRIPEGYLVTAWFIAHASDKMDFLIYAEFNLAKVAAFTRQTGEVFFASGGFL